jgi:hypothetical protein
MTNKQKLLLLLISTDPKLWTLYRLVRVFDRVDFPANISINLQPLIEQELVQVDGWFDNGTPGAYIATDKGRDFVSKNIDTESIRDYLRSLDEPQLVLDFINARLS